MEWFVTCEGPLASLAEAPDSEAVGRRRHRLVSVPQNLEQGQGATVL